jgi:DNA invertase Pin-like site-specific DNA recombinase
MSNNYTIALYIRLSTEDDYDGESNSIRHQRDLLHDFINNDKNLSTSKLLEFVDDGYSGTSFDRPGMNDLLEHARQGKIQCILMKDLSRMGRSYLEMGNYLEQIFPFLGIRVIAINDYYDSDKNVGTTTDIEIPFKNLINDLYAKDISKKVYSAHKTLMKQGKFISAYAFYGYQRHPENKHQLMIDEEVAPVVKKIYQMYLGGTGVTDIARKMNDEGVMTPLQYKKSIGSNYDSCKTNQESPDNLIWKRENVVRILKDIRYTGILVSNKRGTVKVGSNKMAYKDKEEWVTVENTHEAIITKEDYDAVQERFASRFVSVKTGYKKEHVMSNIKCGGCNSSLRRTAKRRPKFYCINNWFSQDSECFHDRIFVDELQDIVFTLIKKQMEVLIDFDELKKNHVNASEKEKKRLEGIIQENKIRITKLKTDKMLAYEEYKAGEMTRADFIEKSDGFEQQVVSLQEEIEQWEDKIRNELVYEEDDGASMARDYYGIGRLTKELYDTFVEEVVVYEVDRIEVRFRV